MTRYGQSGSGLAEVLISLVIVTVALLALAATSIRVGTTMNAAHGRVAAQALADRQMERLLATPYDQITDGSTQLNGVDLTWTVTTGDVSKEIVLVFDYDVPGAARQDTLVATARQP